MTDDDIDIDELLMKLKAAFDQGGKVAADTVVAEMVAEYGEAVVLEMMQDFQHRVEIMMMASKGGSIGSTSPCLTARRHCPLAPFY